MMHKRWTSLSTVGLLAALASCTLPGIRVEPSLSPIDQAATIVAGTLAAAGISTSSAGTLAPATPTTAPATPTTKPTLYINVDDAKCRSGPGADFQEIASYSIGTTVDLIARDSPGEYWLVKDPSSGSSCWVRVQESSPGGSFETVPEVAAPPVSQSLPGRPGKLNYNFFCDNTTLTTSLSWSAPSGPVNGYRIYRLGNEISEVSASQTSFSEAVPFTYGSTMTYGVAAYNDAGAGQQAIWEFSCP